MNVIERSNPIYITVVGLKYTNYPRRCLEEKTPIFLIREPDNFYDKNAIRVVDKINAKIGYVANSGCTIVSGCESATNIQKYFKNKMILNAFVYGFTNENIIAKIKI